MSTSSYKPQKGRGLPWPLDTDAPSVADQAETPSEMEAALDVRQDEIAKSEILSGINRPSYDSFFAVAKNRVQLAILIMICSFQTSKGPNRKDANGKELTKGLFMRQDKLEKSLFDSTDCIESSGRAGSSRHHHEDRWGVGHRLGSARYSSA